MLFSCFNCLSKCWCFLQPSLWVISFTKPSPAQNRVPWSFRPLQKMKSFKDVATMWCFIICLLFYIVFFIIFLSLKSKMVPSLDDLELVPWRRKWQPTPVFLPGESQGQRSLVGCRLRGRTDSDTTEATKRLSGGSSSDWRSWEKERAERKHSHLRVPESWVGGREGRDGRRKAEIFGLTQVWTRALNAKKKKIETKKTLTVVKRELLVGQTNKQKIILFFKSCWVWLLLSPVQLCATP